MQQVVPTHDLRDRRHPVPLKLAHLPCENSVHRSPSTTSKAAFDETMAEHTRSGRRMEVANAGQQGEEERWNSG